MIDGRQSARALAVRRGVQALFTQLMFACVTEVSLASGRRADLIGLSPKGDIWIVEIKSSLADLQSDTKWPAYRQHCDRLFFATLHDVPGDVFPADAGFIVSDGFQAEICRQAPEHRICAATRKQVTLTLAHLAVARLTEMERHLSSDP